MAFNRNFLCDSQDENARETVASQSTLSFGSKKNSAMRPHFPVLEMLLWKLPNEVQFTPFASPMAGLLSATETLIDGVSAFPDFEATVPFKITEHRVNTRSCEEITFRRAMWIGNSRKRAEKFGGCHSGRGGRFPCGFGNRGRSERNLGQ
jgi:hypothetical protein